MTHTTFGHVQKFIAFSGPEIFGFCNWKALIAGIALLSVPAITQAQLGNLLKRARQTVVSKTNSRIDQKVNSVVDRSLDQIEGSTVRKPSGPTATQNSSPQAAPPAPNSSGGLSSYKKFDFIPGETIICSNDFSDEALGESPTGWNSTGTASVVTIDGLEGKWLELSRDAFYLSDNNADFGENFTVEFDLLLHRNNPKNIFSQLGFGLMHYFTDTVTHRRAVNNYKRIFAAEVKVQPFDCNGSHIHYESFQKDEHYLKTEVKKYPEMQESFNKPIHISMQIQGERLRIWFNQDKIYDLPQAILPKTKLNQLFFFMKGNGSLGDDPTYDITDIKIAKGVANARHKLVEQGEFSTTGILFAVNSAIIKPQSFGVLTQIANILKENLSVRIRITGHTDSDGDDARNLELSEKRAAAVKEILVKTFAIAPGRIETVGMGETKPIEKNNVSAGKSQNRRVEFTKL